MITQDLSACDSVPESAVSVAQARLEFDRSHAESDARGWHLGQPWPLMWMMHEHISAFARSEGVDLLSFAVPYGHAFPILDGTRLLRVISVTPNRSFEGDVELRPGAGEFVVSAGWGPDRLIIEVQDAYSRSACSVVAELTTHGIGNYIIIQMPGEPVLIAPNNDATRGSFLDSSLPKVSPFVPITEMVPILRERAVEFEKSSQSQ